VITMTGILWGQRSPFRRTGLLKTLNLEGPLVEIGDDIQKMHVNNEVPSRYPIGMKCPGTASAETNGEEGVAKRRPHRFINPSIRVVVANPLVEGALGSSDS